MSGRRGPRRNRNNDNQSEENKENDVDDLAEEVQDLAIQEHGSGSHPSDEESGEDLIGENMLNDYIARPELDNYEQEGIDDEQDFDELDYEQRQAAEREIADRLRERAPQSRRLPQALRDISEPSDDDERHLRTNRDRYQFDMEEEQEEVDDQSDIPDDERYVKVEDCRGKLKLWIHEDRTKNWIRRTFKKFLLHYVVKNDQDEDTFSYKQVVSDMCNKNRQSLQVQFPHIVTYNATISLWIVEEPSLIFPLLNEVALRVANKLFSNYHYIQTEIFVRITGLPILDLIRELRQKHLGKLVRVTGVITKRSAVFQQLKIALYVCVKCGEKKGPFYLENNDYVQIGACPNCQSKGPFKLKNEDLVYRNFQKITLQESPNLVPPGRVPRQKEVVLLADNIDVARPGDEVEVIGVYAHRYDYLLNVKHGFPLFFTLIEANYVKRVAEADDTKTSQEEIAKIKELSKNPKIAEMIINSVAPSIYGHHSVKTALALAMFGGIQKDVGDKHKIRGDINVLLLGDPGTAKSQFLKNVEKTFYRSVYSTGKGASAVGLTASVKRDYSTRGWVLEGGALVLADKGICLIDEFDKMNEHDRTSIHEAMEQQSISISKAGIVATLQARCSVIAAANPIKGKYDSQLSFHDNVDLTDPILSRFDILCVIKDEVSPTVDDALAAFVINSHIKNHPNSQKLELRSQEDDRAMEKYTQQVLSRKVEEPTKLNVDIIPQELLKQYILYARTKVFPKLHNIDKEKLSKFYISLRQEAEVCGGINISVRHLESVIRMAEAHAKMHLRENVNDLDVNVAISVMLDSFIQSQKVQVAKTLTKKFNHYITFRQDIRGLLLSMLDKLFKERLDFQTYLSKEPNASNINVIIPIELLRKEVDKKNFSMPADFLTCDDFRRVYTIQGNDIVLRRRI